MHLAAGLALRGTFGMFSTYRGSPFWKIRSIIGDAVFAPFYEMLKKHGVSFQFFHRLENIKLVGLDLLENGERLYVSALELAVDDTPFSFELSKDAREDLVKCHGVRTSGYCSLCWSCQARPIESAARMASATISGWTSKGSL